MFLLYVAAVRVLVDGGGDRWLAFRDALNPESHPNLRVAERLTGDFDSIASQSMLRLREMGTEVRPTPDQSNTDFTKALIDIKSFADEVSWITGRPYFAFHTHPFWHSG